MALENRTWGAGRIYGELLKLGFKMSERTVSRYMPKCPERRQSWRTFLKNHCKTTCALDLFTVFTTNFRQLYGIVIIDHGRRKILLTNTTYSPTSEWILRQLFNAFPVEAHHRYLVLDNDKKFSKSFDQDVKDFFDLRAIHTSYRSPWQNGVCERSIGTLRRKCLDHVIIMGEHHLRSVLGEYTQYYNSERPHRTLDFQAPTRQLKSKESKNCKLVVSDFCGGLHHIYNWGKAA